MRRWRANCACCASHGIERRYYHDLHGYNSRLDELQAAILRVKLPHLRLWNERRVEIARRYSAGLRELPVQLPATVPGNTHVFHVYAILARSVTRCKNTSPIMAWPRSSIIRCRSTSRKSMPIWVFAPEIFRSPRQICRKILPLPIYPELTDAQADYVVAVIRQFMSASRP